MPHLSFLKELTSCCKIAYIKLCGSLRFEINEHSCQMWWTWKACVCKSGWFWALQKKRIKLYLHQANDGLGDKLMDDTRTVWWITRSCWSKWSNELSLSLKNPFKVDIYSLGVACYEILTRCVPFYNSKLKKLQKRIKDGLRLDIPEQCLEQLFTLVLTYYHPNPAQPSFPDIYGTLTYMFLSCSSHLTRMFIDFRSWW